MNLGLNKKKPTLDQINAGVLNSAEEIATRDQVSLVSSVKRSESTISVFRIKPRAQGDIRKVNGIQALNLLNSILSLTNESNVGVISPLTVTENYELLAGKHRLFALTLLALDPDKRIPWLREKADADEIEGDWLSHAFLGTADDGVIPITGFKADRRPVPISIFTCNGDQDVMTAIEVQENAVRRNFTFNEIAAKIEQMMKNGFVFPDKSGRITYSLKNGTTALVESLKISQRTAQRYVEKYRNQTNPKAKAKPKKLAFKYSEKQLIAALGHLKANNKQDDIKAWAAMGLELFEAPVP